MTNNTTAGSGLNRKNSHLSERMTLRLLGGGLSETADSSRKEFQSAYVTDTRLMGVLGMRICWHLPDNTHYKYQYQFFYFDAEEYGFDRYESGLSPICCRDYHQDPSVVREYASSMFGGLGARKREMDEKQAIYILQRYAAFNRAHGIPMPSPSEEYASLLDKECSLSEAERENIRELICVKVRSPYEAANYFLMRSLGRDLEAAKWLAEENVNCELFPELARCTLCRNASKPDGNPELLALGDVSLTCESLIESRDSYYIGVSRIRVNRLKVTEASPVSLSKITPAEAAMILSRSEYVSNYKVTGPSEAINRFISPMLVDSIISKYDENTLFALYKSNNDHVNNRVYRLDNDLIGACYLTESGYFIVFSGSLSGIEYMEKGIEDSPLNFFLEPYGKFEFHENIMWEFISGGYDDLAEFLYDMDYFDDED